MIKRTKTSNVNKSRSHFEDKGKVSLKEAMKYQIMEIL